MTKTVVHETPGLIDLRAFTTFGVNAKPNTSSAIGYFGTGLKYAVAVLCREGLETTVWVGEEPHVFFGKKMKFRDREFLQLYMRRQRGVTGRWMAQELPFTTELGKNWKLWMALRELHSNTLDENGRSFDINAYEHAPAAFEAMSHGTADHTRIIVRGDAYAEEFAKLGEIFLPEGARDAGPLGVQRLPGSSRNGYFRGLRALELGREAAATWNVTYSLSLTEDRTILYPHMFRYCVTRYVMASQDREMIREVLQAPEDSWEGALDWTEWEHTYTPEFVETVRQYGRPKHKVIVARDDAKRAPTERRGDWRQLLLTALESNDEALIARAVTEHRAVLMLHLRGDLRARPTVQGVPVHAVGDDVAF